jgi:hypothetical protein
MEADMFLLRAPGKAIVIDGSIGESMAVIEKLIPDLPAEQIDRVSARWIRAYRK